MSAKRKATDSLGTPSKRARKVTLAEKVQPIQCVDNGKLHHQVTLDLNVTSCDRMVRKHPTKHHSRVLHGQHLQL